MRWATSSIALHARTAGEVRRGRRQSEARGGALYLPNRVLVDTIKEKFNARYAEYEWPPSTWNRESLCWKPR